MKFDINSKVIMKEKKGYQTVKSRAKLPALNERN